MPSKETSSGDGRPPAGAAYADTSVLAAVLSPGEPHHKKALGWFQKHGGALITSVVAEVELQRALLRRGAHPRSMAIAKDLLRGLELIDLTQEVREAAAAVPPANLRSLDAIHVATALVALASSFASFDARQIMAAEQAGLALDLDPVI